jgi:hypothetical protein
MRMACMAVDRFGAGRTQERTVLPRRCPDRTIQPYAADRSPDAIATGLRLAYLGGAAGELAGAVLALAFIRRDSMEQEVT